MKIVITLAITLSQKKKLSIVSLSFLAGDNPAELGRCFRTVPFRIVPSLPPKPIYEESLSTLLSQNERAFLHFY